MSLINDALKKAQKLQSQGQAQPPPNFGGPPNPPAGSGRDRSMPGQLFLLLAFGAGALIALSVLATVYLLRQPAPLGPTGAAAPAVAQAPTASSPAGTPSVAPEKPAPVPDIKAPPPAPPVLRGFGEGGSPSTGPALAPTAPPPAPATASEKFPATIPTPSVAAAPVPAVPATPSTSLFIPPPALPAPSQPSVLDPTKPDPRILAYLDAMQIAGVRVSDTGGKVLMNDRVFRQGEIVDHLLGLRLKKVEGNLLTFVDERGVIYTKNL